MSVDLIHIGYHKCASTFLQQTLFPLHPEIEVLRSKEITRMTSAMLLGGFDYQPDEFKKLIDTADQEAKTKNPNVKTVVTSENLTGNMFQGVNGKHLVDSCFEVFGKTKVLIVLRNQYDYVYSAWRHYIRQGGVLNLKNFLTQKSSPSQTWHYYPNSENKYTYGMFDKLLFHREVEYLFQVFGRENVQVALFEDLVKDFEGFVKDIYSFLGVDPQFVPPRNFDNKGITRFVNVFRWLNAFSVTTHNQAPAYLLSGRWYGRFEKAVHWAGGKPLFERKKKDRPKLKVKSYVPEKVVHQFQESNQKLSELLGKSLKDRGYDI